MVVIGYGVQGTKRILVAKNDLVAIVDPVHDRADYKSIMDVPLDIYDAAIVCVPENEKFSIIKYLLNHSKHVMCEKPLILAHPHNYLEIEAIANETKSYYYTAYNHRFEPGILKIREVVSSGQLGEIYYLSMYYGNGTAQAVRESVWRDSGMGVLSDLGSHLIDTSLFLLSHPKLNFETTYTATFENNAPDFAVVEFKGNPYIRFQVSLCSWKNTFRCELIGSLGSVMMEGLVKWGPSKVELNKRSFPTDIPITTEMVYKNSDLSWNLEYDDFKTKCNNFTSVSLENDMYIQHILYSKNRKI